jgi:hypothetical protein
VASPSERTPAPATDGEREATARFLREQHVAGNLTLEAFGDRVARTYSASTVAELDALVADLPDGRERPRPEVVAAVRAVLEPAGYRLDDERDGALTFVRKVHPGWTIAVAIILFPVGLLALLVRRRRALTVHVDARSRLSLGGEVPPSLRRQLEGLRFA